MKKGYYTDSQGRCLGAWEMEEKPPDSDKYKWFESDNIPEVYIELTKEEQILLIQSQIDHNAQAIMNAQADDNSTLVVQLKAERATLKDKLNALQ